MTDKCRVCGEEKTGIAFNDWVKPTFNNWSNLQAGNVICKECLFWFREKSTDFARKLGKDKPQTMRNYSHFIKNGIWYPLSKGQKDKMIELLITAPFPEKAVIADSGQKHIFFLAFSNPRNQKEGWVQFETQKIWVNQLVLIKLISTITKALDIFSKVEINSANYAQYRIIKYSIEKWEEIEKFMIKYRGSPIFALSLFLSQRSKE